MTDPAPVLRPEVHVLIPTHITTLNWVYQLGSRLVLC